MVAMCCHGVLGCFASLTRSQCRLDYVANSWMFSGTYARRQSVENSAYPTSSTRPVSYNKLLKNRTGNLFTRLRALSGDA